jgi:DUF1680 family protein
MTALRRLTPVPFSRVSIDDDFWAPRMETNRRVTVPAEYGMCETTGRVAAWDLAWKPGDPNPPHIFWDSDVAKWIEAASYTLSTRYDAELDGLIDQVVSRIARAQQPDGYLNTHYIQVEPDRRWTNLRDCHELYCAGHMIEAAVAHYQATGKRALLDVLCRYADHIEQTFGREPGRKRGYCGHEEIELALVKLHHATGEPRYLRLAQYFVDERGTGNQVDPAAAGVPWDYDHYYDVEARARGEDPRKFWAKTYAYMQSHVPPREQSEVTGHAVRAMYLYSAMADLANELGDDALLAACERLWDDLTLRRMYITGGIGPSASNEGFTEPYDLPDETAYAETCAAVGLVFWAHRMLQFEGNGRYADVMERALYNGAISGVSLDGQRFFYVNPLASRGRHHRQGWFDCACCPPNIARLIASLGEYAYSEGDRDAWVHLYAEGQAELYLGGNAVTLRQETRYPWDGVVKITVEPAEAQAFALRLRIPGWCENWTLAVNGRLAQGAVAARGYVTLDREWSTGDAVELRLDMPVRYARAHPGVSLMRGRVALQRGPVVYCLEGADHPGVDLDHIALSEPESSFEPVWMPDLLGGVVALKGAASLMEAGRPDEPLYRFSAPASAPIEVMAVPYYAWDNRAPGEMRVWFREYASSAS